MNDLIGFFDSGMGGISVLHEACRLLPHENFLFYGDNGNAPYGPKPLSEIRSPFSAANTSTANKPRPSVAVVITDCAPRAPARMPQRRFAPPA